MIPEHIRKQAEKEQERFSRQEPEIFRVPPYDPETYVFDLTRHPYFDALVALRHFVQAMSHHYFSAEQGAKNVDLFMLTPSISSPMGPGSDSEPISIEFGGLKTHLVDSSQFGFEPLLIQSPGMVYCYLPSMRGEEPDHRHLNQFYHCECEMTGNLADVMQVVEGYVRRLCEMVAALSCITDLISDDATATREILSMVVKSDHFPRISFDDAVSLLSSRPDAATLVRRTPHGRDISSVGEIVLAEILGYRSPFWITQYDRDRVPFYQKPVTNDPNKVENADLIFPPLRPGSFGGEVVGCGQRQDLAEDILESLRRQDGLSPEPYEWYIALRNNPFYRTTSGFGLGIERFLVWVLAKDHIRDVSLYPRLKGIRSYP